MTVREIVRGTVRGALAMTRVGRAVEGVDLPDVVCLTYDDGPDPEGTRAVMEALSDRGATGTFFVMANRVRRHPEVLAEVLAEGHEIALHGIDHRDLTHCSPREVRALTRDALALVEDTAQERVRWFRPPYIGLRIDGWAALRGLPVRFVGAGSAIPDWTTDLSHAERMDHLRGALSPGDVVLAHDSWATVDDNAYPGAEPDVDRRRLTADALALAEERGLRPLTLSQAAGAGDVRTSLRVALRRQDGPS